MEKVKVSVTSVTIPTYPEPAAEELPMFAENRAHQRTSGRPYPNKVVTSVDRSHREDRAYTMVTLENEFIRVEILPEIGGRVYAALDKTTGYDFFYKQHVIKPALIGVLGSWISGGIEFNWPFHHRASGFMPCDFEVEELPDGSGVCRLSEHDPIDRMKGMVSVILRPGEARFETRMRLYNRTCTERPFLWWENAAVPVNPDYQIFFPQDVSYVSYHYHKSRTTYPVANGVYNGIPMEGERDISWHRNTREATSYFACASDFDFFGGYDHGRQCGVVHIGDHHVSPGKKLFTWAYGQLSHSWERALTDTDGAYAELMAGSYSDNQPDFAWLAPYETKEFSQHWYPIRQIGAPTFANLNCALRLDREASTLAIQSTKSFPEAVIRLEGDGRVILETVRDLEPGAPVLLPLGPLPDHVRVSVISQGRTVASYTERDYDRLNMPEEITDMPSAAGMQDPDELYLAGVHIAQYRDPHTEPDCFWKEALKRKQNHVPSLLAMAKYELDHARLPEAEDYARRAVETATVFNRRPQSGEIWYVRGRIAELKGDTDAAYDDYYRAFWASDCAAKAMTRIAVIDIRRREYQEAIRHARTALDYGRNNNLAVACLALSLRETGKEAKAAGLLAEQLRKDPLDHLCRFLTGQSGFYGSLSSDPVQTCLDLAFDLAAMGRYADAVDLLGGLEETRPDCRRKPLYYALGYFRTLTGQDAADAWKKAASAELGRCYPSRFEEIAVLRAAMDAGDDGSAAMLLGCLYYSKRQYAQAADLWETCPGQYIARRNLAVARFSHLGRPADALDIMRKLAEERPDDQQLLYETAVLMDKMGVAPEERISLLEGRPLTSDYLLVELAKAYNQAFLPDKALGILLSHDFVPCEGGEHAIADQYMCALLTKGRTALEQGDADTALTCFRQGQELPQSLGAGIWNLCRLIPMKYHEALCLEALGQRGQSQELFRTIADVQIDYFSNMYLKELPYWQAKSLEHLGEHINALRLMTKYTQAWDRMRYTIDNGYYGTTPFFISFVDDPAKMRAAESRFLSALSQDYAGRKDDAITSLRESTSLNRDNFAALYFLRHGFMK